jgi:hypothetical protein
MSDQLVPRAPKRKKQPTAEKLREQLRLAADEIIRLRTPPRIDVTVCSDSRQVLVNGQVDPTADFNPLTGIVTFSGEFPPRRLPWWRRLFRRKA